MTTVDLKKHLIQRISEINDQAFLEAIKTILDVKSPALNLSPEQREEILASREQVAKGLFSTQSELDQEMERWLNGK